MKKKLSKLELALKKIAAALQAYVNDHIADIENPHGVTKTQIGLGNVTNDAQVKRSEMGVASGVATLGVNGKIPSAQLPTGGGDIIEGHLYNGNFYELQITDLELEYVEIGGVKWATMNIGAESVTDTGLYFQWADTTGYASEEVGIGVNLKSFGWAKYKYGNNTSSPGVGGMSKYNSTDNKVILDSSDDAVSVRLGGDWRLPTPNEYQSLSLAVDTTWTNDYLGSGVAGLICTDKTDNTKVLFFPAAGSADNGDADLVSVDYSSMYFTIESLEDNNVITIKKGPIAANIIYSLDDGETWTEISRLISNTTPLATINTGDKILIKGINDRLASAWDNYDHFDASKNFKVYGNVMSLLNGDNFINNSKLNNNTTHHLAGLFRSEYIVDASNLILPALTLYSSSYNGMFRGATALQHGPKMLATTPTGTECCASMFEGCINLEEPIEINFITLTEKCCFRMFCMDRNNRLTTPKMTKSPILRCQTAATGCYGEMFAGNGNLNEITCLITSSIAGTTDWVKNAGADTGTFYRDPSKVDWESSDAVPSGWAILAYTESILDNGSNGSYWSNTRSTSNATKASSFTFNSSSINWSNDNSRFKGFSLRAVHDEEGTACVPERGKIYIDIETNIQYRWDDEWIQLTNPDGALLGEFSGIVILASLPKKTILDKNNNNVLPITHVSAVYNNNGTSVETLLTNMDEKIDNKIIEGYYSNGSFYTTPPITHDYVDIGGTKWATMNLGAESETGYGLYYQWGDTQGYTTDQVTGSSIPHKNFAWADYKYGNGTNNQSSSSMTKYNSTDGKTVLEASDDAAVANWGGSWRMPTTDEWTALGNAVNTAWTNDYQGSGIAGLVCTDKTDSTKTLFFPAAGSCRNGSVYRVGSYGIYWSSSLYSTFVTEAFILTFNSSGVLNWHYADDRFNGFPIRGIYDGPTPTVIIPVTDAIYIDKATNVIYRYNGSTYVQLSAAPVSNSYIEAMWSGYDPLASE